jgi:hypothetical protein
MLMNEKPFVAPANAPTITTNADVARASKMIGLGRAGLG